MDNAIEARGLEKTYRGDVKALKGVSLGAAKGTVFVLLDMLNEFLAERMPRLLEEGHASLDAAREAQAEGKD